MTEKDNRVDPLREDGSSTQQVPEPAADNTPLPDPAAETTAPDAIIDSDPADQANPPVPDTDS